MKRVFILLAVFIFGFGSIGCQRTVPVENPSFTVASKSQDSTSLAVREALRGRGWMLVKETPGKKVAQYQRGSHSATVEIRYSKDNVAIKLLESNDLLQGYNRKGDEVIHKAYAGWIANLEKDIRTKLSYQ